MNFQLFLFAFLFSITGFTQTSDDGHEYLNHPADIQSYNVQIVLKEETDEISVSEMIRFVLSEPCDSFFIDLQSENGKTGMIVESAAFDYSWAEYNHRNNRIWIKTKNQPVNTPLSLVLKYHGVPETGLIIGENKFQDRTYFGDNWPNRAHHWLACVDHPSDKATINFTVTVPKGFECIATGTLYKKDVSFEKFDRFEYRSDIQLPTKVMVIGVANFDEKEYFTELPFPVTSWSYLQDAANGFNDMSVSVKVVSYFIDLIGEYPFEKLANVQSTTQFGGMENAGNIFYDEKAITGERTMEALIAHEIAHQWFGNSASELDWQHIWLSEGFATYFTDLYWEDTYGTDKMNERLLGERNRVVGFSKKYLHPVVDTSYASLMNLLNPNSYQKGAWVLHMLRNEVGDSAFFKGIQTYYHEYQFGNATTEDLKKIIEDQAGHNLDVFFDQWLYKAGHPVLNFRRGVKKGGWEYLTIRQEQENVVFNFDLQIEVFYQKGQSEIFTISVDEREEKFEFPTKKEIESIKFDPNTRLLFEEVE